MTHDAARAAIDGLFTGPAKRLPELRTHLDTCSECRAHYDRTARAFRTLSGRPDEMSPEELDLFAPPFPERTPLAAPGWQRAALWLSFVATAVAAALVVFIRLPADEFLPRGTRPVAQRAGARALCLRESKVVGEAASGACANGDRLSFVATAPGRRFAAVALVEGGQIELVVAGPAGALAPADTESILSQSSSWRPGLTGVALFSDSQIDPAVVEKCARGECPAGLERAELLLGPPR